MSPADYKDFNPSPAELEVLEALRERRVQAELTAISVLGTLVKSKMFRDLEPHEACYVLAYMSAQLCSRVMKISPDSYADWSKAIYLQRQSEAPP